MKRLSVERHNLIASSVFLARKSAHDKHGDNSIESIPADSPRWLAILGEEVGEVCHELTYDSTGVLLDELYDVATVVFAWIASIESRE